MEANHTYFMHALCGFPGLMFDKCKEASKRCVVHADGAAWLEKSCYMSQRRGLGLPPLRRRLRRGGCDLQNSSRDERCAERLGCTSGSTRGC